MMSIPGRLIHPVRRIVVLDHSGHAFTVQLSRSLASDGREVLHLYNSGFSGPRGPLSEESSDPISFRIEGLGTGKPMAKYSVLKRPLHELGFGLRFIRRVRSFRGDVLLVGNTPPFAALPIAIWSRLSGVPYVFWIQDLYTPALSMFLQGKIGKIGLAFGKLFGKVEAFVVNRAQQVIVISKTFERQLLDWGIPGDALHCIPNWALVKEQATAESSELWKAKHGINSELPLMLYSGTLGLKHNPDILGRLANAVKGQASVVVVSEGLGADALRSGAYRHELTVLPFQPHAEVGTMQRAADLLLVILEAEAGAYSVPSKILSYLCAGRPILASLPLNNPAAKMIEDAGAGFVFSPDDPDGFIGKAIEFAKEPGSFNRCGESAREFAEIAFDIDAIEAQFSEILNLAVSK